MADRVAWTHGDPLATPPPAGTFDLVCALYFPLRRDAGPRALRGIPAAVAPGGTLLVVGHDLTGTPEHEHHERGFDTGDYYGTDDLAALLDHDWTVEIHETRPRAAIPEGSPHTRDTVLRARRLR